MFARQAAVSSPASKHSSPPSTPAGIPLVASLLPGLTDVLVDLELTHTLVASSHECDLQPNSVTSPALPLSSYLPSAQIAAGWSATVSTPSSTALDTLSRRICSFYHVDPCRLAASRPTVLLTHISAPLHGEPDVEQVRAALHALIPSLRAVVSAHCHSLRDVYALHHIVAQAMQRPSAAVAVVAEARTRLRSIEMKEGKKRKVAVVQWAEPLYLAGDWVPEVVRIGGGSGDGFTNEGGPSIAVGAADLHQVDVVIFAVCAVGLQGCRKVVEEFWRKNRGQLQGWNGVIAVTDATRLFSRVALSTVVQSAEVVYEILSGKTIYGHQGALWDHWRKQ